MNNTVQKWFKNPEFQKLPFSTKKHTLSNYFDEELTNEKFYALPKTEQTRVRNNFVVMNMAPHMPEAPERGWIGDIGSALAGGVLGAAETGLRVARTVGDVFVGEEPEEEEWTTRGLEKLEDIRMSSPFLRPSKEARSGVRRWVYEGLQSTVQSILAQGPATAVGFFAMGGAPGAIAMYALSGGSLYGVAARDEFLERADARGIDRKVSEPAALKYALAEGGFEFATDLLEAATAGVARPFTRTGKTALKNGIKALLKQRASTIAARVGGVAAAETIGEMATAGTQAEIAHGIDLGDERFWSAAKNAFGPSLVAGLIFGGMGAGINTLQRRGIQQSLVNPETDKKKRMQAVVAVGKELNSISPDIARVWTINAAEAVQDKKPISMDEDLVEISDVKDEVSKNAPMGTNAQGVTEIGQKGSLEKQRIKRDQDRAAEEELATDAAKEIVETDIKQAKAQESAAAEASLAEANQSEIARIWEEMQGAQVEAAAEEVQPASEDELVETPGEVEITKRLTELEEVLSPGQISFIQNKVGQLGSPETVAAEFNADDNVSEYANLFAWMVDNEARKIEKTKTTEQKPADAKAIQGDLLRGPGIDDLGKVKTKIRGESEKGKGQVYSYSSTQVNLPEKEAEDIKSFAAKIPEFEIYTDPEDPSYGREDNPHITVKYGLHTVNPKDVKPLLKDAGPIKAKMGEVSIFENDDFDVVKVDIESPELYALNKKISDNLKVTDTYPDYKPHATIAYVKKGEGKKYVGDKSFEGKEIVFDSFVFSGKDGKVAKIELKGKEKEYAEETGKEIKEAGYKEGRKGPSVKPLTKREKALQEYKAYTESLTPEQKEIAGDLIEDEPKSPSGQLLKIKRKLAESKKVEPEPEKKESVAEYKEGSKKIGESTAGLPLYEDRDGNRYVVEKGVRSSAPRLVGSKPYPPKQLYEDFRTEYLTKGELDKFEAESKSKSPEKEPETNLTKETEADNVKTEGKKQESFGSDYGKDNKLVTSERAAEIRARLKAKLNQLNAGIDPEMLVLGTELAVYHIEAGARSFAKFAKVMVQDLGDKAKPFLKSWYMGAKNWPGMDKSGMDSEDTVESFEIDKEEDDGETRLASKQVVESQGEVDADIRTAGDKGSISPQSQEAVSATGRKGEASGSTVKEADRGRETAEQGSERRSGDEHNSADRGAASRTSSGKTGSKDKGVGGGPARGSLNPADQNHVIQDEDVIVPKGHETKIKANIKAIRLLKNLQQEDRNPTPDEKKILAQYVGWGAFSQKVFNKDFSNYAKNKQTSQYTPEQFFGQDKGKKYLEWEKKYGEKLHPALGGALTEAEWKSAEESTINAHYTSRNVIKAMWNIAQRLGFKGGTVLEPAAGVGHFFGLMPSELADKSTLYGVELDVISAGITEKLYPEANIQQSAFEKSKGILDNSIDLTITNVPFANVPIIDKRHPDYSGWTLHNYYFGRALSVTKPGGLVIAITTSWTMDAKTGGRVREYLGSKADLVGAIRLPNNAFAENAGTEVVTDILILRKKDSSNVSVGADFRVSSRLETEQSKKLEKELAEARETVESLKPPKGVKLTKEEKEHRQDALEEVDRIHDELQKLYAINEYFVKHPEMVLGKNAMTGTMYASETYTVEPTGDLDAKLNRAISSLPENIAGEGTDISSMAPVVFADMDAKEGTLTEKDGKVYLISNGRMVAPAYVDSKGKERKITADKQLKRLKPYLEVRDLTAKLFDRMADKDATDAEIKSLQAELNSKYDAFVKDYGYFGSTANSFLRKADNDFAVVDALEIEVEGNSTEFTKAPIFHTRTIFPFVEPTTASSIGDAANLSIVYRGEVQPAYIAGLIGNQDIEQVKKTLVGKGLAFVNPETGLMEAKDLYLSGNVKKKLKAAKAALPDNPDYSHNVKALEAVVPEDLDIAFIEFRLGSSWIPADAIKDFIKDILELEDIEVNYVKTDAGSRWVVDTNRPYTVQNRNTFGTEDRYAHELIESALNLRRVTIKRTEINELGNKVTYEDKDASKECNLKIQEINTEFVTWAKTHETWSPKLAEIYNDEKNGHVLRKHTAPEFIDSNGNKTLHYPNASTAITLREHQRIAVSRALQESVLLAYGVGTGKTFIYITTAMEMRRIGTAKKPLIVVHNQTIDQYRNSFKLLYPGAKVLIPNYNQRSSKMRKKTLVSMATGDWDAIVLPQSFFDGIANDPERETAFVEEQLDMIDEGIANAMAEEGEKSFTVKDLVKLKQRKRQKLEALLDRQKDEAVRFEQMGIDALLIDEVHAYKRSEFFTKMDRVKGIDSGSSQRSSSLILKSEWVRSKTGGKNIITATGTPISNTMAELWTMLRYVRPDLLEEYGVTQFDDFASAFGNVVDGIEETASGYKEVERFAEYVNGPELLTMFFSGADVRLTKDANLNLPKMKGGKPQIIVSEKSPELKQYIDDIIAQWRAWENLTGREKRLNRHVPLVLYGRAKKAAIDLRLVDPDYYKDDSSSKIAKSAENIYKIWKETKPARSTQIVFLDVFQDSAKSPKFNGHKDIKKRLIAMGVPAKEVVIFSEAGNSEAAQTKMKDQIRSGEARVIIGSTQKLGVGVDIADKLIAAHHVNVPDRPMDIEQRDGRIIRQGNENEEVQIYHYCTKETLDSVMFGRLMKKQRFSDQVLTGDIDGRTFKDPFSAEQASFAEFAAASSGKAGTLLFEKNELIAQEHKFKIAQTSHIRRVSNARQNIRSLPEDIEREEKALVEQEKLKKYVEDTFPDLKLDTVEYEGKTLSRKEFLEKVEKRLEGISARWEKQLPGMSFGDYRKLKDKGKLKEIIKASASGFDIQIGVGPNTNYSWLLKPSEKIKFEKDPYTGEVQVLKDVRVKIHRNGVGGWSDMDPDKIGKNFTRVFNSTLSKIVSQPEKTEKYIKKLNDDLAEFKRIAKENFKYSKELADAQKRISEINTELVNLTRETTSTVAESKEADRTEEGALYSISQTSPQNAGNTNLFQVNLNTIKSHPRFKSAKVTQGDDGVISVRFKNDLGFTINSIDSVDENSVTLNADYGRYGLKPGKKVAGFYDHKDKNITIVEGVGDRYTIDHEFEHFLEKSGVLTPMDIEALNREVEKIGLTPNEETRARYLEEACRNRDAQTGHMARIVQKVIDFIDMIINQFHRTARGVLRDIESGKIGDHAALGDKINEFAQSAAYSVKEAVKKITDNPRFVKWFGDSVVVDENGEPLVVYHGTTMDFTAFDPAKRGTRTGLDARHGFFFAGKPEVASNYAKEFGKDAKGGQVMPVYLSLQNPLQVDYKSQRIDHSKLEKVIKFAKQKGHDGVVVHNIKDGAIKDNQYVTFDPHQIKSIFNKGDFDPNNPNILYSTKEHVTYSTGLIPSGPEVARDIQEDRSFANRIFEQRDVAVHRAQVEVQDLQKKVQALAGKKSRRRHPLGFAYDKRLQRSRESDALDMALMVWRDLQANPDKADEFKTWAGGALKDPETSREQKLSIKRQLSLLDRALNLTDEQKALADEIGELFDKAYTVAKANKVVSAFRDNYVRRIWKVPKGKEGHFFSSGSTGYGFKTFTTARMQRKLETIIDGWMAGYELGIKGLTNSYGTYLQELETILANKDFIVQGYHTRDIEGLRLFSTSRKGSYSDYVELKAPGFKVWEWASKVATEVEPDEEGALLVDDYGRKFFYGAIEKLPETWAVYKVQDGKKSKKALRVFESEEDAEAFASGKDYEISIEHRSAKEFAEAWEERKLYAPKPLTDIINKMTASDRLFSGIPGLDAMARFNAGMKSWILLSSFFHHMAGARSWVFGVHHGWKKKKAKNPITGEMIETAGANPVAAYKAGLKKIEDRHAIIELGVKNGLTLGEMQDWPERALRKETGFAETLANKLGLERTSKVMEQGRFFREKFTDSLFKKYFAGLKAEAFTMEFIHELQKAQNAWTQGKGKRPDIDAVAERTARLINADFGGLHLQRMGRNPTVQKMARLLLLAPDWTESNFRTVTGMVPGLNKWINRVIGDVPGPAGMDKIYRKFWARVALRIAVSTVISQMLLNGTDDSEDFWKEQALSNRLNKYRWTEVDVSKIYHALGIDTEAARKTLSLGGHFFDPLKLFDPASLIKHKASPAVRVAEAVMSGSDWAERPFTGIKALFGTRQTIKKSPHEEKEGFYSRLPATVVNQVTNLQPVQVGYFLRYLQGEQDGLTATLRSMGTSVHTAWPAKITTPIAKGDGEDRVYEAVKDLMDKGVLHMGPPAGKITVGGILRNLTRKQYQEYIEKSSELARVKLQATILSSKWKLMSPERQTAVIENVIKSARKKIRARLKKRIWQDFMAKKAA